MQERKNPLGPTGETVRVNVRRLREHQNLGYAALSRRLSEVGRPIASLGLSRIEVGDRRVDADDLVALALVLGVTPVTLLMPVTETTEDVVELTGTGRVSAERAWRWLVAEVPLVEARLLRTLGFQAAVSPVWVEPEVRAGDVEPSWREDADPAGAQVTDQ